MPNIYQTESCRFIKNVFKSKLLRRETKRDLDKLENLRNQEFLDSKTEKRDKRGSRPRVDGIRSQEEPRISSYEGCVILSICGIDGPWSQACVCSRYLLQGRSFKQHSDPPIGVALILWLELPHHLLEFVDFVILVVIVLHRACHFTIFLRLRSIPLRCITSDCKKRNVVIWRKTESCTRKLFKNVIIKSNNNIDKFVLVT